MRVFTEELVRASVARGDDTWVGFDPLEAGPYALSIQGGAAFYSTPRVAFDDPNRYLEWEVVLAEQGGEWLDPVELDIPVPGLRVEPGSGVMPYVPTAVVQALFTWCIMQDGEDAIDRELLVMEEEEP